MARGAFRGLARRRVSAPHAHAAFAAAEGTEFLKGRIVFAKVTIGSVGESAPMRPEGMSPSSSVLVPSFGKSLKRTNSSGLVTGNGLSTTAFINVKMAVLAPMPSARITSATRVKAGRLSKPRQLKRMSFQMNRTFVSPLALAHWRFSLSTSA